ncbi:hypothetical protein [Cyclonatronum proteinivorum]|uniref:hypothetical protein n=1 Tax=Cyclonatronum proteinivorum TaxID=1457365 RepID=UPI000F51BD61|nr:hypothetical protein [Cyclonatronum proteinivorum]
MLRAVRPTPRARLRRARGDLFGVTAGFYEDDTATRLGFPAVSRSWHADFADCTQPTVRNVLCMEFTLKIRIPDLLLLLESEFGV